MQPTSQGWKVFDAAIPVLTCSYSFGPAPANALAVGADGGLFVVSPPYHATEGAFEQLRQYGAVSGSAPGLRFNNIAPLFMVRDRRALRRWLAAE